MIKIENISKSFGKLKALDTVNVCMNSGECIALIGPNGCGKTTLIKAILGMVIPSNGVISVINKQIYQSWSYRQHIGYMPQIGHYPENMTIGQIFDMMKDIRKSTDAALDMDLYAAFQMHSLIGKRMGTLSGGTRQKVSACLAFMFKPEIMILDEPTAGLDPLSTEILKQKIKQAQNDNKLILITSHILSDLDELASHVIYMEEGVLLFKKDIVMLKEETGERRLGTAVARIMSSSKI